MKTMKEYADEELREQLRSYCVQYGAPDMLEGVHDVLVGIYNASNLPSPALGSAISHVIDAWGCLDRARKA